MSDFLILAIRPEQPPIKVTRRSDYIAALTIATKLYEDSDAQIPFRVIDTKQYWCRTCGKSDHFDNPTFCHEPLTLTGNSADWYCGRVHGCWNWSAE